MTPINTEKSMVDVGLELRLPSSMFMILLHLSMYLGTFDRYLRYAPKLFIHSSRSEFLISDSVQDCLLFFFKSKVSFSV